MFHGRRPEQNGRGDARQLEVMVSLARNPDDFITDPRFIAMHEKANTFALRRDPVLFFTEVY